MMSSWYVLQMDFLSSDKREHVGSKLIDCLFFLTSFIVSMCLCVDIAGGGVYSPAFLLPLDDYLQALKTAVRTYREHKPSWEGLMRRGMQRDCTWENAAIQYEQVFEWAFIDPPYVRSN